MIGVGVGPPTAVVVVVWNEGVCDGGVVDKVVVVVVGRVVVVVGQFPADVISVTGHCGDSWHVVLQK